jgi:hypothetical protein
MRWRFLSQASAALFTSIDVSQDDTGLLIDQERPPRRVPEKKAPLPEPSSRPATLCWTIGSSSPRSAATSRGAAKTLFSSSARSGPATARVSVQDRGLHSRPENSFNLSRKDDSLFHAAVVDAEPGLWARRVIKREHIQRRLGLPLGEGKEDEAHRVARFWDNRRRRNYARTGLYLAS